MTTVKIATAGVPTINDRTYSQETWQRAIDQFGDRPLLGMIGSPDGLSVPLEDVSHEVTAIWMEGSDVMCKIKVLDTPPGLVLAQLMASGFDVGFRSCGAGTVNENGEVTDFTLTSIAATVLQE